eukprot:TRINITY_DN1705_c0_g1_i1.p1 TRINITY_DN1705_c0_g1~~TRINITY_DN1705_c0_g1_i1.p1  ORF type:complete len:354 (+),score=60.14 TRINITY_DN1705_c0_g1_i1:45-1106(+)
MNEGADDEVPQLLEIDENIDKTERKKIPVTILTGFLGAGKTTLLRHILTQAHGKRIAILQNEFGEKLGLEESSILSSAETNQAIKWLEFPNGCLCCTVKGDMLLALENLIQTNPNFDYVIIETTGLADPGPLARSFWVDSELESLVFLDAIICVVDSVHFSKQISEKTIEAERQVALSDVLLINKCDLTPKEQVKSLLDMIRDFNSMATLYETVRGVIDLEKILDLGCFNGDRGLDLPNFANHLHKNKQVTTCTLVSYGYVDLFDVESWLGNLLWEENSQKIYRIKGVLNIKGSALKYSLQAVQELFSVEPSSIYWEDGVERENKMVFIGKNLNIDQLKNGFEKLVLRLNVES